MYKNVKNEYREFHHSGTLKETLLIKKRSILKVNEISKYIPLSPDLHHHSCLKKSCNAAF